MFYLNEVYKSDDFSLCFRIMAIKKSEKHTILEF
jgi:hypothetical protein